MRISDWSSDVCSSDLSAAATRVSPTTACFAPTYSPCIGTPTTPATDAIGMGLNLDVSHVAFAGLSKFGGKRHRRLTTSEMAQIAGRAGRHQRDGKIGRASGRERGGQDGGMRGG